MVARNPKGYLGGLIILTSDKKTPHKKKPKKNCTLDYTQPGMHRTASSYYGYGTGTDRTFLCSQSHCPGRDSILVPSDLQARSLAPPLLGSPESKCSFHIFSFPTGVKGLKISKGTSRIRTQVVGMERPGLTSQATDVSDLTWEYRAPSQ